MTLTTPIPISRASFDIAHSDRLLLVGSCFADEIGAKLAQGGFDALVNPFGTLYNPASIAMNLSAAIAPQLHACPATLGIEMDSSLASGKSGVSTACHVVESCGEGERHIYHSWMHHTRFYASSREELERRINAANKQVADRLRNANVLIITLGTAIIYRLKENGMLVANCHKQPDSLFARERLTAGGIVGMWQQLIEQLAELNPQLRVIFTVSPIRHKRDGMHINQISKGILLQAVDEIVSRNSQCLYFPAYEIMLDELRDYRFYADDMIHPSPLAVEYIWQRFQDAFFTPKTRDAAAKAAKAWRRTQHREICL